MINKRFLSQIGLLAIALVFLLIPFTQKTSATTYDLFGSAWSDNIGWVTFNCASTSSCGAGGSTDYKVSMDGSTGKLSGYAWSDNIGWILFDPSPSITACGDVLYSTSACIPKINLTNGRFSGFARALSYGGGWSGWIDLSGATASSINLQGLRTVSGNTWGSDVVGWLDMSGVTVGGDVPLVNVTLTASPSSWTNGAGNGGMTTLTWTSTNATSCSAVSPANWTNKTTTADSQSILVQNTTTFSITCTNGTDTATANRTVPVGATPNNIYVTIFNPSGGGIGHGTTTNVINTVDPGTFVAGGITYDSVQGVITTTLNSVSITDIYVDANDSINPTEIKNNNYQVSSIYQCSNPSNTKSLPFTMLKTEVFCFDVPIIISPRLPGVGAYHARFKVHDSLNDVATSNDFFIDAGGFGATKKIKVIER